MKINDLVNSKLDIELDSISSDSRSVSGNGIYFAFVGLEVDGHDYIDKAIDNGAKLIYHTKDIRVKNSGVHYEKVADIIGTFNYVSSKFYGFPTRKLHTIATTGTNGKTTTSWIINDILNKKYKSGYIGTVGAVYNNQIHGVTHTTPLANDFNKILRDMVDVNVSHIAVEVSSHALDQRRVEFLNVQSAIMTNITHEHLDYHKTMDEYLKAKGILFKNLSADSYAILNIDDDSYEILKNITKANILSYGKNPRADLYFHDVKLFDNKSEFKLNYNKNEYQIMTNLTAEFNIYNLCGAFGALLQNGFMMEELVMYAENLSQIPGRMEIINYNNKTIIVDYAHTPDGFEKFYKYIDDLNKDKVISVFGSAGKRDFEKREVLGEIASKSSDMIILTEEDYRSENPEIIADEIKKGIPDDIIVKYIENRKDAIEYGFEQLKAGEILAILAKGSEQYLYRGDRKDYYDGDTQVVENLIKGDNNE